MKLTDELKKRIDDWFDSKSEAEILEIAEEYGLVRTYTLKMKALDCGATFQTEVRTTGQVRDAVSYFTKKHESQRDTFAGTLVNNEGEHFASVTVDGRIFNKRDGAVYTPSATEIKEL